MKHWIESDGGISLAKPGSPTENARVVWIARWNDDTFTIGEECDGHFSIDATREQLIETLEEALEWVKAQPLEHKEDEVDQPVDFNHRMLAAFDLLERMGMTAVSRSVDEKFEICASLLIRPDSKHPDVRNFDFSSYTRYDEYSMIETRYMTIDKLEQFVIDNAHLAN